MWRSVARFKQTVARNFGVVRQNPTKVQSFSSRTFVTISQSQSNGVFTKPSSFIFNQNLRFLSQASSSADDPTDYDSSQKDELAFDYGDDAQFDSGDIKNDEFVENDSTQMNDESGIADVDENPEPEVFEVDLEKLEAVLSFLRRSIDGSLDLAFHALGLHLHEEFMVRLLESPHLLGENLIAFFKWAMEEKQEFKITTKILDRLVRAMCCDLKKKNAYALWDFLKEIGEKEKGLLNADILNELISCLSKLGKGKAALEVFDKFEDLGCVPNGETYYVTIEALYRRSCYDWAWSVCEKMLDSGSLPESDRVSKIISWYCKADKAKEAHSVYIFAKEREKHTLSQSSFSFLISSLCKKDDTVKLALEMLDDLPGEARKHAIKPFSVVISALCRMKEVDKAASLVCNLISEGPPPGNSVFNSVISGYSKIGELGKAKEMIKLMESRGLKPDLYSYAVIISGYANGGQMYEACRILAAAKKKHSKLSHEMYDTLIHGYCELEEFEKALKLLAEMKDFGVEANVGNYNKIIKSLCLKALDWDTADSLFNEMKEKGLPLSSKIKALIRAVKELEDEKLENVEETVEA